MLSMVLMIKYSLAGCFALLFAVNVSAYEADNNFYFNAFSVKQGGTLQLFANFQETPTFNLEIYALDTPRPGTLIAKLKGIKSTPQLPSNDKAYENGAGWKPTTSLKIGTNWPSGFYGVALFDANNNYKGFAAFTVRTANPSSYAPILFLDSAPTNIAYNDWGGKSTYYGNQTDPVPATSVSLLRPGQNFIDYHAVSFSIWAKNNGIKVEYASMLDVEKEPGLLANYAMVVVAGHSEYWSNVMRDNFDSFIRGGGNGVIMSGNTMWWQVRIDTKNNKLIAYKERAVGKDPLRNDPVLFDTNLANDKTVTSQWSDSLGANFPENKSIGVSFRNGGYVNLYWNNVYVADEFNVHGAYTVTNAAHWIFKDTGLKNGDIYGKRATIVGNEVDGALFTVDAKGNYNVTGTDGTPVNTQILSVADARMCNDTCPKGAATLVVTEPFPNRNGGLVFNAATIDWTDGLYYSYTGNTAAAPLAPPIGTVDPIVSQITKNVLQRFLR